jgi:ClpP class serine protease
MRLTKTNILMIIGLVLSTLLLPGIQASPSEDTTALIQYLNQTGGIPVTITTTAATNWTQFALTLAVSSIFILFFFGQMLGSGIDNTFVKLTLNKIKRNTGRDVVFIKHTNSSLFNQSMIDQKTASKLSEAMAAFKGKDFDIILHTPGGEVFSALMISRILKQYPGKIRTIIPSFAMSGGTLLALSTDELIMNRTACMGPVDPQLGNLFKMGSAKSWERIVKFKGKRAEDSSISMAMEGSKYTKTIANHLNDIVDFGLTSKQKKAFIEFITIGGVEHAYALTPDRLQEFGIPVKIMQNPKVIEMMIKITSKLAGEGVTYTK